MAVNPLQYRDPRQTIGSPSDAKATDTTSSWSMISLLKGIYDQTTQAFLTTAYKTPCRLATSSNITLSGTQTIDGVAAVSGDRILVNGQTDQTENGIYVVAAAAWSRASDFDEDAEVVQGAQVNVILGTSNSGLYELTTSDPITLDTSNIVFNVAAGGDMSGPASSTDNAVVRFTGTGGKTAQNSGVLIDDSDNITGVAQLTATTFVGALTGDVTGNVSGTAATVTGAAQTNITSLGTLTSVTVDNITINGNTITADTGALNLTPAAGSAIVLDGTINVDAGVVTGATSITSTAFVGALTGNADTATVATTVTITDNEATAEENAVIFAAGGDIDGGDLGLESDGNLTYNPSTGTLTATTFAGAFSGNADTVTVGVSAGDATSHILMSNDASGSISPLTDPGLTYDATTNVLTAAGFAGPLTGDVTGNVSGTAATVTGAAQTNITSLGTLTTLTVDNITINGNTITADTGALNLTPAAGSAIVLDGTINVDAGVVTGATSITSTAFVGALTGNADTVTVADAGGDTTTFPLLGTAATGSLAPATDAGLTYNATTNALTATTFVGALTGDVTGNCSGTAATVTGAAQTNITSLGTLTTLTVDNLTINGNTITADTGALNLTPAAGSAIVLDGTINVDAGVVTGATSITSTAFVGALTGNADTVTVADAGGDATTFPLLGTAATGSLAPATDAGLTYNATTNALTAGSFVGALTGQADTVATITGLAPDTATTQAAQPNITSLGTLTGLTSTGVIDLGGATSFELPNSATPTVNADGEIALDTTVTDFSHGVIKYYGGEEMGVLAMPIAEFTSPTDSTVVSYNATNDEFELVAIPGGGDALTSGTLGQFASTDSATLAGVMSDETGTGLLVFATDPVLTTPNLGTPSAGTLTNCDGLVSFITADESTDTTCFPVFVTAATGEVGPKTGSNLTFNSSSGALTATSFVGALTGNADTVTTNANLTGHVTSTGNAAVLGSFTVAQLSTALSDASISGNNTGDEITATTSAEGVGELATSAEYRANSANVRLLESNQVWDAMAEVALTSTSNSVAWDMSLGIDFDIDTLGENTTIANPTSTTVGKKGRLRIVQDGTGTRTVAWGTNFEFAGGTAPTASTAIGAEDVFYYDVISATRILITAVLDIS